MEDINREIYLFGPINSESAAEVCSRLFEIDNYDLQMEQLKNYEPNSITLYINSDGGELSSSLAIIDAIHTIAAPVIVMVYGMAASGAFAITCAAEAAYAGPKAQFMFHGALMLNEGMQSLREIQYSLEDTHKHAESYYRTVEEGTNWSYEEVMDMVKNGREDYWFNAEEALEHGIIHSILPRQKEGVREKTREILKEQQLELKKDEELDQVEKELNSDIHAGMVHVSEGGT